jgi:heme oxygenase
MKKHSALLHMKQATENAHRAAERTGLMQPLMRADVSVDDYLHALNGLYHWLDKYEVCLQTWLPQQVERSENYHYQPRTSHIVSDIHALGGFTPPPQIHHEQAVSVYQALGYAYVIEGSTQGGRMLKQRLENVLQLDGKATNYFGFYQQGNWQRFIRAFERLSLTDAQLQEMTNAALSAFRSFTDVAEQVEQRFGSKVAY